MNRLLKKQNYQLKLNKFKNGGLILKCQNGTPSGHVWPIIDSWDPRRWGDPIYEGTFNEAYRAARKNGDKTFQWNGKSYNTSYKHVPASTSAATPAATSQDLTPDYNSLRAKYIEALENPDRVGYDASRDRWTSPTQKGYDHNQIGIGLDKNTNNDVKQFLAKNKRNWLTNAEMLNLQNKSFKYVEGILSKNTKGMKLSNVKRAAAIGLLYHGHGPKLWNKNHFLSKAFFNGSDQDFIDAITKFYGTNTRATRHSQFWKKFFGK